MDELAIKIEHVSKQYRLGAIGGGTLRGDLQTWWARKRGKEDPNSKIGARTDVKIGERFLALDDINLEVKKGEALGIIGHNGAGKSTLLKLLSRVTAPTTGNISYNGRITSMLEVGTGFHPELTGRENIYMNGAILGLSKKEIDAKMEQIIDFSEVRQFIDTPVKRYSSGMYVKLAFSVAAHLDSEIMIMDEVLAVGDMAYQRKCLTKMREAADKEGRTVLYVSHNMNTIRQLCDRCVVLDHGKVIYSGNVDKAIEIYLGSSEACPRFVDLRNANHAKDVLPGLKITEAELIEGDNWSFEVGGKLRFLLRFSAEKKLSNISLRSRLYTMEDKSITVIKAPNLISCSANSTFEIPLEADLSSLVPGMYSLTFALYDVDQLGHWSFFDHIDKAITFEVFTKLGFNDNMVWDQRWWGNVQFPNYVDLRNGKNDSDL